LLGISLFEKLNLLTKECKLTHVFHILLLLKILFT